MKKIKLTQGQFALVDDEDFEELNQYKWFAHKSGKRLYAERHLASLKGKQKIIKMHRFLMQVTDPKIQVDHKDGNGLNNQKENLRPATHSQNQMNKEKYKKTKSVYKGVFWQKQRNSGYWRARIRVNKKLMSLGCFKQEEDAALAYNMAALILHDKFANLNEL